ncbi:hypothetical protein GDO78_017843 [Eleutherodactylus coqui]|uniref:Uncharacterized protein n=1 Tax=Eleutherodactylus coqui TaxID=57060 RepID=A0A8J6BD73_ELECQ|nr:hypothetical protein GDO78_017843 [Eleutherodactylus coqui]
MCYYRRKDLQCLQEKDWKQCICSLSKRCSCTLLLREGCQFCGLLKIALSYTNKSLIHQDCSGSMKTVT